MSSGLVPIIINLSSARGGPAPPTLLSLLRDASHYALGARQCEYCGLYPNSAHIDHIIPKSIGGSDGPENLAIACAECNLRKGMSIWLTANGRAGALREEFVGKIDLPPPVRCNPRIPETIQKYSDAWMRDNWQSSVLDQDMDALRCLVDRPESGELVKGMSGLLSVSSDDVVRHNLIMAMEDAIVCKQCHNGQRVDIALCYAMSLVNAALERLS